MPRRTRTTIKGERPAPPTILAAYEAEATTVGRKVAREGAAAVRAIYPAGRHNTRATIRGTVTKTATGIAITIKPGKRRAYIARFVEGGTGDQGPRHRRIPRNRRGRLPGTGRPPSGHGQAPQWPFERTREGRGDQAVRELSEGASGAARRLFG